MSLSAAAFGLKRKRNEPEIDVAPAKSSSAPQPQHDSFADISKLAGSAATLTGHAHAAYQSKQRQQQPLIFKSDAYYRDLYESDIDFRQMGLQDPEFSAVLKRNGQLDFTDPKAVMQLTKSTLKLHFGLSMELPDDRLCPPVPNRHNYILWLKDLLDSSSYDLPGGKLTGLDIGTGASCIYPLLGCMQRPWEFIATDVDKKSLSYAEKNIAANKLSHRIKLVSRPDPISSPLIPLDTLGIDGVDFVMTNPPFYESQTELLSLAAQKALPPSTACTGAPVEMVHPAGGEVGFVTRILSESLILRERVRWYTSMLGKLSSLEVLVEKLRDEGVTNYAVTEFVQGTKTKRWALGWSFSGMRASQAAARGMAQLAWRKVLPASVEVELVLCVVARTGEVAEKIDILMRGLELESWAWDKNALNGTARTKGNTWGRAWRRRKAREKDGVEELTARVSENDKPLSGFEVAMIVGRSQGVVLCRWREGHDEAVFQSFCSFLKTNLEKAIDYSEKK